MPDQIDDPRPTVFTAAQLRSALDALPADDPVMLVMPDGRSGWLRGVRHDSGARTVDLHASGAR